MAVSDMELEALVGHLFIVGGRMISSASPGAIAMSPPRRAARGRDSDSFFSLISLAPGERQPATFYKSLLDALTETYYNTTGGVTTAMREAIAAASQQVYTFNRVETDFVTVGLACAVLRGSELFVAVVGPARAFLIHGHGPERMPSDFELHEGVLALGAEVEPDIRLYRHHVQPGDFLLLADPSFNRLSDSALSQAASSGQIADLLNNLVGVASPDSACEVIEFVTPLPEEDDEPEPLPRRRRLPALPLLGKIADPSVPPAAAGRARRAEPSGDDAGRKLRQAGSGAAKGLAGAAGGLRVLVERWMPAGTTENPLEQRFKLSVPAQIGIALGVALLTALLTYVVYRMRGDTSQYAQLVREAQSEIEQARDGLGNQAEARPHWETAIFLLDRAAEIRQPGEEIVRLREEAIQALDAYDHVTRISPVLMRTYREESTLRSPVARGLNLYVIDTARGMLYREDLSENGASLTNRNPRIVTQQGEVVGNHVIDTLVDLVWVEEGGVPQRNVLGALTSSGQFITYSPSWDVTVVALPGAANWGEARAMALFDRDLYVLDAGANMIWRYAAGPDSYPRPPEPYFTDVTPDLGDAVDMEIDTNGNIYVLHEDGEMTKYFLGKQEPFIFEGLPQPVGRGAGLFMNVTQVERTLFIADPAGGRLYATALSGAFLANYKDDGDVIFDQISGVYRQDTPAMMYVTAGNRLYYFSLP